MKANIDDQSFIEQVIESIASIQKQDRIDFEMLLEATSGSRTSFRFGTASFPVFIDRGILGKDPGDIQIAQYEYDKEIKTAIVTAKKEIFEGEEKDSCVTVDNKRKIKKIIIDALCPSLLKTSDDVFEIAKSSTPVLLTLSLSGTISLPIQPVFFAAAAILLARSSITAICKDSNQSSSK